MHPVSRQDGTRDYPFSYDRKGYHVIFDTISAWVCAQCGEVYFEEAEVEAIQKVMRDLDKRTGKLALSA